MASPQEGPERPPALLNLFQSKQRSPRYTSSLRRFNNHLRLPQDSLGVVVALALLYSIRAIHIESTSRLKLLLTTGNFTCPQFGAIFPTAVHLHVIC
jgi:hypothetical protein